MHLLKTPLFLFCFPLKEQPVGNIKEIVSWIPVILRGRLNKSRTNLLQPTCHLHHLIHNWENSLPQHIALIVGWSMIARYSRLRLFTGAHWLINTDVVPPIHTTQPSSECITRTCAGFIFIFPPRVFEMWYYVCRSAEKLDCLTKWVIKSHGGKTFLFPTISSFLAVTRFKSF